MCPVARLMENGAGGTRRAHEKVGMPVWWIPTIAICERNAQYRGQLSPRYLHIFSGPNNKKNHSYKKHNGKLQRVFSTSGYIRQHSTALGEAVQTVRNIRSQRKSTFYRQLPRFRFSWLCRWGASRRSWSSHAGWTPLCQLRSAERPACRRRLQHGSVVNAAAHPPPLLPPSPLQGGQGAPAWAAQ